METLVAVTVKRDGSRKSIPKYLHKNTRIYHITDMTWPIHRLALIPIHTYAYEISF